jgi:hypothetical protein
MLLLVNSLPPSIDCSFRGTSNLQLCPSQPCIWAIHPVVLGKGHPNIHWLKQCQFCIEVKDKFQQLSPRANQDQCCQDVAGAYRAIQLLWRSTPPCSLASFQEWQTQGVATFLNSPDCSGWGQSQASPHTTIGAMPTQGPPNGNTPQSVQLHRQIQTWPYGGPILNRREFYRKCQKAL